LIPIFAELGRAHRKLGVRTVHYGPFGSAFLEALRGRAGAAWRPEYEAAWLRAYGFSSDVLSSAAQSHLHTTPDVRATVVHHTLRRPDLAVLRVQPAQPYPFVAGQYATVESPRLPHAWRSYSIASAPGENEPLEFHVRATGTGRLSDVLVHHTRVGDVLRLAPARGTVTLAPPSERGVLLAAGGTGLATVKALLTEVARRPDPRGAAPAAQRRGRLGARAAPAPGPARGRRAPPPPAPARPAPALPARPRAPPERAPPKRDGRRSRCPQEHGRLARGPGGR